VTPRATIAVALSAAANPGHAEDVPAANRFFTAAEIDLMHSPGRWRLVAPGIVSDLAPIADARHRRWGAAHAHEHAHQEVMLALDGSAPYGIGDEVYPCEPGTLLAFASNRAHDEGYPPGAPRLRHLWISVIGAQVVPRLLDAERGRITSMGACCVLTADQLGIATGRALDDAAQLAERAPGAARLRLLDLVASVCAHTVAAGWAAADDEAPGARAVEAIRQHLLMTCGKGVGVDELARIAGYSTFHFLRLFKRHAGQTVHEFIDWCRVRRVEQLRRSGALDKDIAHELGFSCASAFSRWQRARRTRDERGAR